MPRRRLAKFRGDVTTIVLGIGGKPAIDAIRMMAKNFNFTVVRYSVEIR